MDRLRGKKALVTGGGSGIGNAIVRELADRGAEVLIHYFKSGDSARALVDTIRSNGGAAEAVQADLSTEDGARSLAGFVERSWGSLEVLVNNTGDLVGRRRLEEADLAFYRSVMAANLDSLVFVTRALIPLLRKPGAASIVNLSSLAGRKGGHGGSLVYSTAKGAILSFTRSLSTELAPDGIRVNAVAPGLILGSAFHRIHTTEESKQATIRDIPLRRAGTCEDVARAVAFLAGEYDGFITGATLDINGGVYMA